MDGDGDGNRQHPSTAHENEFSTDADLSGVSVMVVDWQALCTPCVCPQQEVPHDDDAYA
jgi:hypothetical protein